MFRRLLAYVTLGIFLLNVLGYYAVFVGARKISANHLSERLNTDMYDLGGNVTIKVPLALPYEVTSEHFERSGGQFEMDGEVYHIIKQRHYKDTLYMVCIRDVQSSRINSALTSYVESFGGQEDTDQQTVPGLFKDFLGEQIALEITSNGWEVPLSLSTGSDLFVDSFFSSIVHPPERIVA